MPILLGQSEQGENVFAIDLSNARGDSARVLSLGGILQSLNIATADHGVINTVLGYEDWTEYLRDTVWMGPPPGAIAIASQTPGSQLTPRSISWSATREITICTAALDFLQLQPLSEVLDSSDPIIARCHGLDHNWARGETSEPQPAAQLYCPDTQLLLDLKTTLPGLQCYTGNHLADHGLHHAHAGIALEPQYYPDSPNQHHFQSPILRRDEVREHEIQLHIAAAAAS